MYRNEPEDGTVSDPGGTVTVAPADGATTMIPTRAASATQRMRGNSLLPRRPRENPFISYPLVGAAPGSPAPRRCRAIRANPSDLGTVDRWRLAHPGYMHGREGRSEEHTSELQSRGHLVCRL